jgi:hypothetical protein
MTGKVNGCWLTLEYIGDGKILKPWWLTSLGRISKSNRNQNGADKDSHKVTLSSLTKKAEPPPTNGVNRDSGTASANGGWLRRLVRLLAHLCGGRVTNHKINDATSKGINNQILRVRTPLFE